MIFFDEKNPNKYNHLKKLLTPYSFKRSLNKKKIGCGDGGYVIDPSYVDAVLSYGIGSDPEGVSFETEMLDKGCEVHMYDGSIGFLPVSESYFGGVPYFKSEYLTEENFKDHLDKFPNRPLINSVLKMDIEGNEYKWLTDRNLKLLSERFGQFTIEVHSLIEETPEGWVLEPQIKEAKENKKATALFFQRLNKKFTLWHIHGNNHSPRYVDFPDSLELTYVNKKLAMPSGKEPERFPVEGLDEPNFKERDDYVLDWWLYTL